MNEGTKVAHTPGPWMADECDGGAAMVILANDDEGHAFNMAYLRYDYPERNANGKLIAAAPELLAACEAALPRLREAVEQMAKCGIGDERVIAIHHQVADAIARATKQRE